MGLSKSRFTTGLQCHRYLWWRAHEPDAPELVPDAALQAHFDRGSLVGRAAREYVPGGILIDFPHTAFAERLEATRQALDGGARVVYEASFLADDTFVAVDVLERVDDGWRLIEVKSTTSVKDEHYPDVAVQMHVLRRCGLPVDRAELMHLNPACAYPELGNLFARPDVTAEAERRLADVPDEIGRQLRMLEGPLPDVPVGRHCEAPHECPFLARCRPALPDHHISTLYHVGKQKWELEAGGCVTIDQLPAGFRLRPPAVRQLRAIQTGSTVVDPGLGHALRSLEGPLAVMDFETVNPAIPLWLGCHPCEQVPVQFSCHVQDGLGGWTHHEWLAEGPDDPRPELIRRLAAACAGARTILAYYATFEKTCLQHVARALPELQAPVESILGRLADALPLVRDHVYHLSFGGSFSLKTTLPVLVPELGYEGMEIANGQAASVELERLLLHGETVSPADQARLRAALLRYCELDTWGVVRLLERLRELAESG